ncbi:MAG TPA: hypothetical protein VGQ52_13230 [Gemmatimonadaceae bacterium]|nr:hypothetical protein [Gemmatimonadaceae bacterium]
MRGAALLGVWLTLAATACHRAAPPPVVQQAPTPAPPPISPWPGTLANANRAADLQKFDEADAILAKFALEHPGTAEGAEADFWRALFRMDPFNTNASLRDAMAALDSYINAGPATARYAEARVLRRLLESLDSSRTQLAAARREADSRDRVRDDEIRKLGDELDKTMAELDRIRRRLAQKPNEN